MTENEYIQLHVVLERVLEGNASDREYVGLQKIITMMRVSRRIISGILNCRRDFIGLKRLDSVSPLTPERLSGFLCVLGEQEAEAESVELKMTPSAPQELIQKVVREKTIRKINKMSLATAIVSMAAVILLVVFAISPRSYRLGGGGVIRQHPCQVADSDLSMEAGMRLGTGDGPFLLREGMTELLFDNNARITIEAPAEFKILTNDQIKLSYGRLYAIVPGEAVGLLSQRPRPKLLTWETEFGVQADFNGTTELHVVKGKTSLVAGLDDHKISLLLNAGSAKRMTANASCLSM